MIKRTLEKKLLKLANHFPALALLGPRQVGKTTLAKMLMQQLPKPSLYFDLENPLDLARLENPLSFFQSNKDKCIIIDEVQHKPELFATLRSMIDEHRVPTRFILLGSASPALLRQSSESLAGRIVYIELTPLLLEEISVLETKEYHWLYGGFPEPFLIKDAEIRTAWYQSFVRTYLERDLPSLGLNTSPIWLRRFFMMLAHSHGQLLNKANLSKSLEISQTTITTYLDFFQNAYLTRTLPPYHANLKKRLIKTQKVFIRDSGILFHLLNISDYNSLLGHPIVGHSWEGYVIEQIIANLGDEFDYYFYRTHDGAECDLVITRNLSPVACVEVKFTSAPKKTKSLTIAVQDINAPHNYVVIPEKTEPFMLDEKVTACSLEGVLQALA